MKVLFPLLLCALATASCGHKFDTQEDPSIEEIIAIGKGYLMEGNGASACDAFDAALKIDDTNPSARFGALLADDMSFVNLVDALAATLSSLGTGSSAQTYDDRVVSALSAAPSFSDLLHDFLDDVLVGNIRQGEEVYAGLAADADFGFNLDRYDLSITGLSILSLGGEFDKTDARFMGAVNALLDAVLDLLLAHNLDIDIASLALPTVPSGADTLTTIDTYVAFLEDLLEAPGASELLTLDGPEGAEFMQDSGVQLGAAFDRVAATFDQLELERDNQSDDPIRYSDLNFNGVYDPATESVAVGEMITLEPELVDAIKVLAVDLSAAFWDNTEMDVDPTAPNPFHLSAANGLLHYLDILPLVLLEDPFVIAIDEIPDFLTIDVGAFFSQPDAEGLRGVLEDLISLWNDLRETLGLPTAEDEAA